MAFFVEPVIVLVLFLQYLDFDVELLYHFLQHPGFPPFFDEFFPQGFDFPFLEVVQDLRARKGNIFKGFAVVIRLAQVLGPLLVILDLVFFLKGGYFILIGVGLFVENVCGGLAGFLLTCGEVMRFLFLTG